MRDGWILYEWGLMRGSCVLTAAPWPAILALLLGVCRCGFGVNFVVLSVSGVLVRGNRCAGGWWMCWFGSFREFVFGAASALHTIGPVGFRVCLIMASLN